MNQRRADKLKVDFLRQGKVNGGKVAVAKEIAQEMGISMNEVAYIGDDVNCYELLSLVGVAACPADACDTVKGIPGIIVINKNGGDGCVRIFCEMILKR